MSGSESSDDEYKKSQNNFDEDSDNEQNLRNPARKYEGKNKKEEQNFKKKSIVKKYIKLEKKKYIEKQEKEAHENYEDCSKVVNETDEDFEEDNDEDEYEDDIYNVKSPEYLEYKKNIFSSDKPTHSDAELDYYYISGSKNVKKFINLKKYGKNLEIVEEHVKQIAHNLEIDENPKIYSPITIIEYHNYNTDSVKNIAEIIDGHHRILALESIYKKKPNFKIDIRINIIKSDFPDSPRTNTIFRKFNIIKPFIVDFDILDTTELIVKALNLKFSNNKFEFIKDTDENIRRPTIKLKEIHGYIQQRLNELKITKKINYNDISFENIITEFERYNNIFSTQNIERFNNDKIFKDGSKTKISELMFNKAVKYNCFIGLVNLKVLIEKCITYNL